MPYSSYPPRPDFGDSGTKSSPKDETFFACLPTNSSLWNQDPPTIDHYSNINQRIKETESLNLTCTADGYPEPTITWTKSPGTITKPNIGNMYTILSAKRSDTGTYKCTASNGIASDAMASIQVTVQSTGKISDTGTYKCTASNGILSDAMTSMQVTVQYYAAEIYQTLFITERSDLNEVKEDLEATVPEPLHCMLEKENKDDAIRRFKIRKEKQTVICPPTCT
ncbi:hypothetical protein QZH41_017445, partial [Actinostola sp. cb2023]